MRVLVFQATSGLGGGEKYVSDLSRAAVEQGHDVLTLAVGEDRELPDGLRSLGMPVEHVDLPMRFRNPRSVLAVRRILQERAQDFRPDLVLANLPRGMILARLTLGFRKPFIGVLHSPGGQNLLARIGELCTRHYLFNTPATAAAFLEGFWGARRTGRVLAPVADDFGLQVRRAPRRPIQVVMIGRFQRYKGHLDFVAMAAHLRSAVPEATFTIVGAPSPAEPEFLQEVNAALTSGGLLDRCRLELNVDTERLREILDQSCVYVHPAHSEDFGISIVEALSAGLPVVSYDTDGARILLAGEHGVVVGSRDPRDLAQAVLELVDEPAGRYLNRSASAVREAGNHVYGSVYEARVARILDQLSEDLVHGR